MPVINSKNVIHLPSGLSLKKGSNLLSDDQVDKNKDVLETLFVDGLIEAPEVQEPEKTPEVQEPEKTPKKK